MDSGLPNSVRSEQFGRNEAENKFRCECGKVENVSEITSSTIEHLVQIWRSFQEGYPCNFVNTDKCLESLLVCTAKVVFNVHYSQNVSSALKTALKVIIRECGESINDSTPRRNICMGIASIVDNPWCSDAFNVVANTGGKSVLNIPNEAAENLWNTEGWVMLETRIDYLVRLGKKCANRVCSVLHVLTSKGHQLHSSTSENESSATFATYDPYKFTYEKYLEYLEVYAVLVFKQCIEVKTITSWEENALFGVIERLIEKTNDTNSKRLFPKLKFWKEVDKALKFVVRTAAWIALKKKETKMLPNFFVKWMLISTKDGGTSPLDEVVDKLDEVANTDNLYLIAESTIEHLGKTELTKPKFVEIYVRALTKDINSIEALKANQSCDKETILELAKKLSYRYIQLANFFSDFPRTVRACLFTSFSLYPCYNLFKCLFPSAMVSSEDEMDLVTKDFFLQDKLNAISETQLEICKDEEEDPLLPSALWDDLNNVINSQQYSGLFRWNSAEEQEKACRVLLTEKSVDNIENRKLDFVNVDYDKYKDLPSQYDPDDDGIETGYRKGERRRKHVIHKRRTLVNNGMKKPKKANFYRTQLNRNDNSKVSKQKQPRIPKIAKERGSSSVTGRKGRPPKVKLNGENVANLKANAKEGRRRKIKGAMPNIKLPQNPWISRLTSSINYTLKLTHAELFTMFVSPHPHECKEVLTGRNSAHEELILSHIKPVIFERKVPQQAEITEDETLTEWIANQNQSNQSSCGESAQTVAPPPPQLQPEATESGALTSMDAGLLSCSIQDSVCNTSGASSSILAETEQQSAPSEVNATCYDHGFPAWPSFRPDVIFPVVDHVHEPIVNTTIVRYIDANDAKRKSNKSIPVSVSANIKVKDKKARMPMESHGGKKSKNSEIIKVTKPPVIHSVTERAKPSSEVAPQAGVVCEFRNDHLPNDINITSPISSILSEEDDCSITPEPISEPVPFCAFQFMRMYNKGEEPENSITNNSPQEKKGNLTTQTPTATKDQLQKWEVTVSQVSSLHDDRLPVKSELQPHIAPVISNRREMIPLPPVPANFVREPSSEIKRPLVVKTYSSFKPKSKRRLVIQSSSWGLESSNCTVEVDAHQNLEMSQIQIPPPIVDRVDTSSKLIIQSFSGSDSNSCTLEANLHQNLEMSQVQIPPSVGSVYPFSKCVAATATPINMGSVNFHARIIETGIAENETKLETHNESTMELGETTCDIPRINDKFSCALNDGQSLVLRTESKSSVKMSNTDGQKEHDMIECSQSQLKEPIPCENLAVSLCTASSFIDPCVQSISEIVENETEPKIHQISYDSISLPSTIDIVDVTVDAILSNKAPVKTNSTSHRPSEMENKSPSSSTSLLTPTQNNVKQTTKTATVTLHLHHLADLSSFHVTKFLKKDIKPRIELKNINPLAKKVAKNRGDQTYKEEIIHPGNPNYTEPENSHSSCMQQTNPNSNEMTTSSLQIPIQTTINATTISENKNVNVYSSNSQITTTEVHTVPDKTQQDDILQNKLVDSEECNYAMAGLRSDNRSALTLQSTKNQNEELITLEAQSSSALSVVETGNEDLKNKDCQLIDDSLADNDSSEYSVESTQSQSKTKKSSILYSQPDIIAQKINTVILEASCCPLSDSLLNLANEEGRKLGESLSNKVCENALDNDEISFHKSLDSVKTEFVNKSNHLSQGDATVEQELETVSNSTSRCNVKETSDKNPCNADHPSVIAFDRKTPLLEELCPEANLNVVEVSDVDGIGHHEHRQLLANNITDNDVTHKVGFFELVEKRGGEPVETVEGAPSRSILPAGIVDLELEKIKLKDPLSKSLSSVAETSNENLQNEDLQSFASKVIDDAVLDKGVESVGALIKNAPSSLVRPHKSRTRNMEKDLKKFSAARTTSQVDVESFTRIESLQNNQNLESIDEKVVDDIINKLDGKSVGSGVINQLDDHCSSKLGLGYKKITQTFEENRSAKDSLSSTNKVVTNAAEIPAELLKSENECPPELVTSVLAMDKELKQNTSIECVKISQNSDERVPHQEETSLIRIMRNEEKRNDDRQKYDKCENKSLTVVYTIENLSCCSDNATNADRKGDNSGPNSITEFTHNTNVNKESQLVFVENNHFIQSDNGQTTDILADSTVVTIEEAEGSALRCVFDHESPKKEDARVFTNIKAEVHALRTGKQNKSTFSNDLLSPMSLKTKEHTDIIVISDDDDSRSDSNTECTSEYTNKCLTIDKYSVSTYDVVESDEIELCKLALGKVGDNPLKGNAICLRNEQKNTRPLTPVGTLEELINTKFKRKSKRPYEDEEDKIKVARSVYKHVETFGGGMRRLLLCVVPVEKLKEEEIPLNSRNFVPVKRSSRLKSKKMRTVEAIKTVLQNSTANDQDDDSSRSRSSSPEVEVISEILNTNNKTKTTKANTSKILPARKVSSSVRNSIDELGKNMKETEEVKPAKGRNLKRISTISIAAKNLTDSTAKAITNTSGPEIRGAKLKRSLPQVQSLRKVRKLRDKQKCVSLFNDKSVSESDEDGKSDPDFNPLSDNSSSSSAVSNSTDVAAAAESSDNFKDKYPKMSFVTSPEEVTVDDDDPLAMDTFSESKALEIKTLRTEEEITIDSGSSDSDGVLEDNDSFSSVTENGAEISLKRQMNSLPAASATNVIIEEHQYITSDIVDEEFETENNKPDPEKNIETDVEVSAYETFVNVAEKNDPETSFEDSSNIEKSQSLEKVGDSEIEMKGDETSGHSTFAIINQTSHQQSTETCLTPANLQSSQEVDYSLFDNVVNHDLPAEKNTPSNLQNEELSRDQFNVSPLFKQNVGKEQDLDILHSNPGDNDGEASCVMLEKQMECDADPKDDLDCSSNACDSVMNSSTSAIAGSVGEKNENIQIMDSLTSSPINALDYNDHSSMEELPRSSSSCSQPGYNNQKNVTVNKVDSTDNAVYVCARTSTNNDLISKVPAEIHYETESSDSLSIIQNPEKPTSIVETDPAECELHCSLDKRLPHVNSICILVNTDEHSQPGVSEIEGLSENLHSEMSFSSPEVLAAWCDNQSKLIRPLLNIQNGRTPTGPPFVYFSNTRSKPVITCKSSANEIDAAFSVSTSAARANVDNFQSLNKPIDTNIHVISDGDKVPVLHLTAQEADEDSPCCSTAVLGEEQAHETQEEKDITCEEHETRPKDIRNVVMNSELPPIENDNDHTKMQRTWTPNVSPDITRKFVPASPEIPTLFAENVIFERTWQSDEEPPILEEETFVYN